MCAGIVSGLYVRPSSTAILIAASVIISGFLLSLLYNRRESDSIYGYTLTVSLFLTGLLLYANEKDSISVLKPERSMLAGTILDYPVERKDKYLLTLKLSGSISRSRPEPLRGSILLYLKKDPDATMYLPGDLVIVNCTPAEISARSNPYEFDYRFYMENQGIRYNAHADHSDIVRHFVPGHRKFIYRALIIREKIIGMYKERGITGDRLSLVAAITLGQKNMLDPGQKNNFIRAGVMHIMAVSGLHTAILSLFIFNVLFFLKGRLIIVRIIITISVLWAFAFVTGLTPSVLRATMMFSFLQAGKMLKRPASGINSVLASAVVLIIIRPSVIFDAGFLLSYAAVIYIITFYKYLYQAITVRNFLADKIWQSAVVTIVAQAGTLPLTIALFNRFPTYFIITNLIIVPLSSLLVITGCLVTLFYPLKLLSRLLALLLNSLTGLTELLTGKASELPFATVENIGMTTVETILLTAVIFLFTLFLLNKKAIPVIYPLSALLIFIMAGTITGIATSSTSEIIVYSVPGHSEVGIRSGKILNLYSDTTVASTAVKRHCSTLGLRIKMNMTDSGDDFILAGKTRILLTGHLSQRVIENFCPDIVVLTGLRPEVEPGAILKLMPGTEVIAEEGFPLYAHSYRISHAASSRFYLVGKSGAFIRRI